MDFRLTTPGFRFSVFSNHEHPQVTSEFLEKRFWSRPTNWTYLQFEHVLELRCNVVDLQHQHLLFLLSPAEKGEQKW